MLSSRGSRNSLSTVFIHGRECNFDFREGRSVASHNKKAERHLAKLNNTKTMCDNFIIKVNKVYSLD